MKRKIPHDVRPTGWHKESEQLAGGILKKSLLEIAVEIVKNQASSYQMSAEDIELALSKTFGALQRMQQAEEVGNHLENTGTREDTSKEIDPKESIQKDQVICLECGAAFRQLTLSHLEAHGLTPRAYKKKYGFPAKQPLAAKALTRARSKEAKKRGLPENLKQYLAERKRSKEESVSPQSSEAIDTPESTAQVEFPSPEGQPARKRRKRKTELIS
jgi:predicted transcriptional regulator